MNWGSWLFWLVTEWQTFAHTYDMQEPWKIDKVKKAFPLCRRVREGKKAEGKTCSVLKVKQKDSPSSFKGSKSFAKEKKARWGRINSKKENSVFSLVRCCRFMDLEIPSCLMCMRDYLQSVLIFFKHFTFNVRSTLTAAGLAEVY